MQSQNLNKRMKMNFFGSASATNLLMLKKLDF